MRNKIIVGALSGLLILGGAAFVSASKNDTRPDDSNHQDDKKISASVNSQSKSETTVNGQKVEIETEHGKKYVKVDPKDSNSSQTASKNLISSDQAAEIAMKTVDGTVREIEQEIEHGKMQYKVELTTSSGEAKVRIDAETAKVVRVDKDDHKNVSEDNDKSGDGSHQNRHSGDDDNKTDDGSHQNRHSGDDDN
ncbi:PepSY domain-containing protein [Neobacillus pocheonensis]|uniref:PepSY domain-containing protein n=1 Tax=Neobacillus pocheonensis TaxID=363869 RepID=UPI003D294F23